MLAESKEPTINIRTEFLADKFTIKLISIESDRLPDILCELYVISKNKKKTANTTK